jgi:GT2 family glycosyltransferase
MNKKIGIVTITYNSSHVIIPFMECILHQTHKNFTLYIIDNCSSDNTLELLRQYDDPRIQIIANNNNVGVAAGNNQGIRRSLKEYCDEVLILNNDIECEYTLLEKLSHQMAELNCSMVAPKMMYHPETNLIWWAGTKFNPLRGCMTNHIGIQEEDTGQYDTIERMDYAPTCCVLIKKEVFEDIGLMDEKYFVYYDDTDFFYRAYVQKKHTLYYYPFIRFYHKVGGLSNMKKGDAKKFTFNNFYLHLFTRNHVYYLRKQKHLIAWLNIFYYFFYMNARFFLSGKYVRNLSTFLLLQRSYWEGLLL